MPDKTQPLVLIVDDSLENVRLLEHLLTISGYQTASAKDGKIALAYLQKNAPDLILLDIMMPGLNGYEVCIEAKQIEDVKDIPIIFLSAKSDTEDLVKGFEAGGVDYITKPFKTAELLARIKTHVELKQARDEIHMLRGIIPICAGCKKIRDDKGLWKQIESYIEEHSKAQFSHGLCLDCAQKLYGKSEWFEKFKKKREAKDSPL
ncbi:MAG: response regulator [SAR324 cluster bacterium]|nr:response regulator [SAR324 cluster bacterium]